MMKKIIQIIIYSILTLSTLSTYAQNTPTVVVEIPRPQGYKNINIPGPTSIQAKVDNTIGLIQLINSYLWFSIGFVGMIGLVYGGFQLITARGSDKVVESANKIIMNSIIGILIAIFSYMTVRLIINMF